MKTTSFSLFASVFFAVILTGSGQQGCKSQQWEPLFNGKDLEGWTVRCVQADLDKEYWTVKEGCIDCNSMGDRDHNYV